ncbi:MAG TPA: carboxypeptidase-like regulatory domain-containing protein, partial [Actinomycetota bacterium]|nr:carboxypeptidase-like regulatory domain-containing protein [Actinomycetota bacterium]
AVPLGATYKALIDPPSPPTGFEQPAFDDSAWPTAQAAFGFNASVCSGFTAPNTVLPHLNSTVYLRKSFALPANAFGVHVTGTVDNFADVYVNGTLRQNASSPSCTSGGIDAKVSNGSLNLGGNNLVAARLSNATGPASYLDLQVTYGTVVFSQQPSATQQGSLITPNPAVTITDADGQPVQGATVAVSLQTVSGSGTFTGGSTTSATTDASGVATFSNLAVTDSGQYRLVASSDGATTTSTGFQVADQIAPCNGNCSAHGSKGGTNVDASATNAPTGSSLLVSVIQNITPPSGICQAFVPLGAGSFVDILSTGTARPDITVTWRLDKALVQAAGNPAASSFNICLGAVNLDHPDGSNTTPWTTKSGSPATAVPDAFLGVTMFWGVLPDCAKKGKPAGPCVLKRNKNSAGDEIVDFFLPAPWDASFYGG